MANSWGVQFCFLSPQTYGLLATMPILGTSMTGGGHWRAQRFPGCGHGGTCWDQLDRTASICFTQKLINTQRKFRNLISEYTESCRPRSVNEEMWSRRCDTAEMIWDVWDEVLAGRTCAKCCVSSKKRAGVRRIGCPRCRQNLHHAVAREPRCGVKAPFKVLFAWQVQGPRQRIHIKMAQTFCNSEVKCLVNVSFFKEVPQKSFS